MGNKTGTKRFSDDDKTMLLDAVEELTPSHWADQWANVQSKYMEAQRKACKEANEEHRKKKGSLKSLFNKMQGKRRFTGNPTRPELVTRAKKLEEGINNKTFSEFTEKFGSLADVIASYIEAKNRGYPPSRSNNNNDERLTKLEENLTSVSGQFRDIHSMLQSLLADKVSSGGNQQENESNKCQLVK
ncbi:hypothetical protein V8B55DRAFT_1559945 [Mucor lusitanicus]